MGHETAFNGVTAGTFAAYEKTVRGHIRYELVKRNLGAYVTDGEISIADIGGGAAIDAIWLAGLGHRVIIVDPAEDQLALAAKKLMGQPNEIVDRIDLNHGTVSDLLDNNGSHSYDLVLSHGVAMYLDKPREFIYDLAKLVKPGGSISLLEKGFYGAYNSLIHEGLYEEARTLALSGKLVNHQKREVWAFKPEELISHLGAAGATHVDWSGVRVAHDFDDRQRDSLNPEELSSIVQQEEEAGKREDLRAAAPMLHFIAKMSSL